MFICLYVYMFISLFLDLFLPCPKFPVSRPPSVSPHYLLLLKAPPKTWSRKTLASTAVICTSTCKGMQLTTPFYILLQKKYIKNKEVNKKISY